MSAEDRRSAAGMKPPSNARRGRRSDVGRSDPYAGMETSNATSHARGNRRADVGNSDTYAMEISRPAKPMKTAAAGRPGCDRRSAEVRTGGRESAAGAHTPGRRAGVTAIRRMGMRYDDAMPTMQPNCRADDRAAPAKTVAARIVAGAVRAVLLPALVGLHSLHRRYVCERRQSAAAHVADARPGRVRSSERRHGEGQTGENAQSGVRHRS